MDDIGGDDGVVVLVDCDEVTLLIENGERESGLLAWNVSSVGLSQAGAPSLSVPQQCQRKDVALYTISGSALPPGTRRDMIFSFLMTFSFFFFLGGGGMICILGFAQNEREKERMYTYYMPACKQHRFPLYRCSRLRSIPSCPSLDCV